MPDSLEIPAGGFKTAWNCLFAMIASSQQPLVLYSYYYWVVAEALFQNPGRPDAGRDTRTGGVVGNGLKPVVRWGRTTGARGVVGRGWDCRLIGGRFAKRRHPCIM